MLKKKKKKDKNLAQKVMKNKKTIKINLKKLINYKMTMTCNRKIFKYPCFCNWHKKYWQCFFYLKSYAFMKYMYCLLIYP